VPLHSVSVVSCFIYLVMVRSLKAGSSWREGSAEGGKEGSQGRAQAGEGDRRKGLRVSGGRPSVCACECV